MSLRARTMIANLEKGIGGFDHGDELGVAHRHAAFFFEFADQFVEQLYVRHARDFGAGQRIHIGTNRMLWFQDFLRCGPE